MKSLTVVATFQARAGRENELKDVLAGLLAPTRKEAGCLSYDLHQAPDAPAKFLFYENWASRELLEKHLQSPHLTAALARVKDLTATSPEISFWQKLA